MILLYHTHFTNPALSYHPLFQPHIPIFSAMNQTGINLCGHNSLPWHFRRTDSFNRQSVPVSWLVSMQVRFQISEPDPLAKSLLPRICLTPVFLYPYDFLSSPPAYQKPQISNTNPTKTEIWNLPLDTQQGAESANPPPISGEEMGANGIFTYP